MKKKELQITEEVFLRKYRNQKEKRVSSLCMKKISIVLIVLFWGCSQSLPQHERDFSEFIPQPEQPKVYPKSFDFVENNFPENCRWALLDRIIDGDTVIVDEDEKIRFIGIDTPESKDIRKPLQRGALEATEETKRLLGDEQEVCLVSDAVGDEIDTYGRTLSYIFTKEGIDVNAELLKNGFARGYFYFPFSRRLEFEAYQQMAKNQSIGLWQKGSLD